MNARATPDQRWATPPFASADRRDASDLSLLGAHYRHCNGCNERWFSIRCAIDAVHAFVAPRFMTTLLLIVTVAVIGSFVL